MNNLQAPVSQSLFSNTNGKQGHLSHCPEGKLFVHIIDQYAYSNRLRKTDPAYKAGLALTVLALCLLLNEPLVGLTAAAWMYLLAVRLAGLSARVFGRVLAAEAAFLLLTTIGVVLSFSLTPPGDLATWAWKVGPVWVSSSPPSLAQGVILVTRALGAASAMNFLALTTPLTDIIELLRRWRVPLILIDLMAVVYRFIFVLLDSLDTMYKAQGSRSGYHTGWFRSMNNAALLGSRLFIDAFQRSRRLQLALESRGYDGGNLRVLPVRYQADSRVLWAGSAAAISLVMVWIIL